jgi:hypothetical protein|tara:strand:+ start:12 stop:155 length:144 start_codon:yes stop_codon:yes gene_type:complete
LGEIAALLAKLQWNIDVIGMAYLEAVGHETGGPPIGCSLKVIWEMSV